MKKITWMYSFLDPAFPYRTRYTLYAASSETFNTLISELNMLPGWTVNNNSSCVVSSATLKSASSDSYYTAGFTPGIDNNNFGLISPVITATAGKRKYVSVRVSQPQIASNDAIAILVDDDTNTALYSVTPPFANHSTYIEISCDSDGVSKIAVDGVVKHTATGVSHAKLVLASDITGTVNASNKAGIIYSDFVLSEQDVAEEEHFYVGVRVQSYAYLSTTHSSAWKIGGEGAGGNYIKEANTFCTSEYEIKKTYIATPSYDHTALNFTGAGIKPTEAYLAQCLSYIEKDLERKKIKCDVKINSQIIQGNITKTEYPPSKENKYRNVIIFNDIPSETYKYSNDFYIKIKS